MLLTPHPPLAPNPIPAMQGLCQVTIESLQVADGKFALGYMGRINPHLHKTQTSVTVTLRILALFFFVFF